MYRQLVPEHHGRGAPAPARRRRLRGPQRRHAPQGPQPADDARSSRTPGIDASWARSKSVDEFLGQAFDYVITVCDQARQVCPVFPGAGQSLHWGYEDPAEATGTDDEVMAVYREVFTQIGERIHQFVPLALRHRSESDATTTLA